MPNSVTDASIVDKLYEAAVVPELWPATLAELATATGAKGALIVQVQPKGMSWQSSPELHEHGAAFSPVDGIE